MEKTTVFNLIILDESGSMSGVTQQTVSGCNETLNVIRSLQNKYGDTQRNLVSIYLFQSGVEIPSRYLVKNVPISEVKDVTTEQYRPWGATPLLDAVGSTLVDLRAVAATHEDSTGMVTIITDGMENSSTHYTWAQVASLIKELKEQGWTINLIGANIDVDEMGRKMEIDNTLAFKADQKGTEKMWNEFGDSVATSYCRRMEFEAKCALPEERTMARKKASTGFFNRKKK